MIVHMSLGKIEYYVVGSERAHLKEYLAFSFASRTNFTRLPEE